jgi:polyhydroxyalkanoate synthase
MKTNNHSYLDNIHEFLIGINRFYDQFSRRGNDQQNVIWQEGSTKVIEYKGNHENPALVFIPSLINKSYILDLSPEFSLINYLNKLGHHIYLIDFNEPEENELSMGFLDYQERIIRAIKAVCGEKAIIIIGYCLGGVFSCAISASKEINIIKQVLLATAWDLSHLRNPFILNNFKFLLESMDRVPPSLIQCFFSSLAPSRIWDKFCQFTTMQDKEEIAKFLAIEQWVNDGISLSKKFGQEAISMITENTLEHFLKKNTIPSLIINGSEDNIAPVSSVIPIYEILENKDIMVEKTGHIGLIVSKFAQEKIWPKIADWLLH